MHILEHSTLHGCSRKLPKQHISHISPAVEKEKEPYTPAKKKNPDAFTLTLPLTLTRMQELQLTLLLLLLLWYWCWYWYWCTSAGRRMVHMIEDERRAECKARRYV